MITRFRVNNFRNLINLEFRPVRINLIVGPNNAGKTNLCNALRFISITTGYGLDDSAGMVVGENWNISNAYLPDKQIDFEVEVILPESGRDLIYDYRLKLNAERDALTAKQTLRVIKERLLVAGLSTHHVPLIQNEAGNAEIYDEKSQVQVQTLVPTETTALSKVFDPEANRHTVIFKQQLANSWYFNLNPTALRSPKVVGKSTVVLSSGENLNKLLFSMHNENPRLERKIIDALKLVEPKIDLFKFFSPDPDFILFLFEDKHGHAFSPQSMSDGTLRYLVLCGLFVLLDEWSKNKAPAPLILFEEPENGLYVGSLKPLFAGLDFQSSSGQCVFTSHSPYFIDLFDNNIEGVHVMHPGTPSPSLSKPDPAKVRHLLKEMPLGELHYREMLG
jgi:predicted ATPase